MAVLAAIALGRVPPLVRTGTRSCPAIDPDLSLDTDLPLSLVIIGEWEQKPSSFWQVRHRGSPDGVRVTHVFAAAVAFGRPPRRDI